MTVPDSCSFCRIHQGKNEASIVYKDNLCTAFMDIQPINPGHVLIIPNKHAARLSELDEETGAHLFKIAIRISRALPKSGLRFEGLDVLIPDGEGAGQEVYHTHLHIFPRFKGDGFGLKFGPDYTKLPDRAKLDEIAEQIKNTLSD